jgi:hypothetical protein
MITLTTNFRDASFRTTIQETQEMIQVDQPFLERLKKVRSIVIENLVVTGKQIAQLFDQTKEIHVQVYFPQNYYDQALGYQIEEERTSKGGYVIHINGCRLILCKSEIIATLIHQVVINLIIHSKGNFFEAIAPPKPQPQQKQSFLVQQVNEENVAIEFDRSPPFGTFIFHSYTEKGYEFPRNILYDFLKKEVRKEICCCCFPFC